MRRKTAALLAMTAAAAAGLLLGASGAQGAPPRLRAPAHTAALRRADVARARWVLADCGGRLALYRPLAAEPEIVFSVRLSSLPQADRERLARGIEIEDDERLLQLLEDYTS